MKGGLPGQWGKGGQGGLQISVTCIVEQYHVLLTLMHVMESLLLQISEDYLSEPMTIEYPTDDGQTAFMNYYAPKNQNYQLPPGETPPLLVKIHGGPTSQASTAFNLGYQYWTSRGGSLSHEQSACCVACCSMAYEACSMALQSCQRFTGLCSLLLKRRKAWLQVQCMLCLHPF